MSCCNQIETAVQAVARAVLPPERISLSEWADRHRRLSSEGSVQPGNWQTMAFQREPLDAIGPQSPYSQVVLMWCSQVGKSENLLNLIAYIVAEEPGPILCVQPTLAMAEAVSKDRISPMFRDMPILRGKVADPKARDSGKYHLSPAIRWRASDDCREQFSRWSRIASDPLPTHGRAGPMGRKRGR